MFKKKYFLYFKMMVMTSILLDHLNFELFCYFLLQIFLGVQLAIFVPLLFCIMPIAYLWRSLLWQSHGRIAGLAWPPGRLLHPPRGHKFTRSPLLPNGATGMLFIALSLWNCLTYILPNFKPAGRQCTETDFPQYFSERWLTPRRVSEPEPSL